MHVSIFAPFLLKISSFYSLLYHNISEYISGIIQTSSQSSCVFGCACFVIYHGFCVNVCREFKKVFVRLVLKVMFIYCSRFVTYIFFLSKVVSNLYKMETK